MLIKNVVYIPIEAVGKDNSITMFMPGEVKEVSDEIGQGYLDRYNDRETVFVEVKAEESKAKAVKSKKVAKEVIEDDAEIGNEDETEEVEETVEEKPAGEFVCDVCGKVCGSKIGLTSHKRKHA